MISLINTSTYKMLLKKLLDNKIEAVKSKTGSEVIAELIGECTTFEPCGHIDGTNEDYVTHELDWYLSQDLCIKHHKGIENNKVWKACATVDGMVNSNYGWCIFSPENKFQFSKAVTELLSNKDTRQAILIYSRPNIHNEKNDGIHAKYDMICTIYTMFFIRNDTLYMTVHMRSNDVWYGLRNDLAWQQWVYEEMYTTLSSVYKNLLRGNIKWFADSLHLYARNLADVEKYIE